MSHTPDDVQRYQQILRAAWKRTGGAAWEPPRVKGNRFFDWAVAEGYLSLTNSWLHKDGFQIPLKDTVVEWTDAGRAAMGGK